MTRDEMIDYITDNVDWLDDWELAAVYLYTTELGLPSADEISALVDAMGNNDSGIVAVEI